LISDELTTTLDLFSPPFLHRRGQMPRLASPAVYCKNCGQPLIETNFNRTHCVLLCDNWRCCLFRQSQGSKEKPLEPLPIKKASPKTLQPFYQGWLKERKKKYCLARDLGFGSKEAMHLRGKPMKEIRRLARK